MIRTLCLWLCLSVLAACQSISSNSTPPFEDDGAAQAVVQQSKQAEPEIVTPLSVTISDQSLAETTYDDVWQRMAAGFQLTEYYDHEDVLEQLETYQGNQRYFDLVAERASPFLHWIVEEIDRRGLPQELALLPVVESTFNPNAYSREHAVGLWQFLGPTGRSFGLQQDWWYDARRDPRASTIAALDYLQVLYQQFNEDWLLALAAYNTGDGNLRRAIRRSGSDAATAEFWDLPLARETRSHIPKILALAVIISDSEQHSISLNQIPNQEPLAVVEIGAQIDIAQAARLAELDYGELRALNPGYLQWATHPNAPQNIVVPKQNTETLIAALKTISRNELVTWDRYQILAGDTLGAIASKLGTRVDILQTVNQLRGSRIIAGDSLLIPRTNDTTLLASIPPVSSRLNRSVAVPPSYTVRRGDNLWSIARRFDIKSVDIARWNSIELDSLLQPGQVLAMGIPATSEVASGLASQDVYIVKRGDSMAKIARRFNARLEELLNWNQMAINEIIFPGQQIRILTTVIGLPKL